MSDRAIDRRGPGTLVGRARDLLRPIYDVLIGDPVEEGRLRLDRVSPLIRQVAAVGLVALIGLLTLLLATGLLRQGELLHLSASGGRFTFVPVSLVPITLIALLVGWCLVTWGAVHASPAVGAGIAAAFLLLNAAMSRVQAVRFEVGGDVQLAPGLVRVGYFAVPAVLVLHAVLGVRPAWRRRATPVALGALAVTLLAYYGGLLWTHVLQVTNRVPLQVPFTLESSIHSVEILMLPLLTIGGVAIIEFAQGVASAATLHVWKRRALVARILLATLVAAKLFIQVGRHVGDWGARLAGRPEVVVTTALILLVLVGAALWARRQPRGGGEPEGAKEGLIFAAAVILALPGVIVNVLRNGGEFLIQQFGILGPANALFELPLTRWITYADALLWALLLPVGIFLLRRSRSSGIRREAGIGLILLGAWAGTFFVLELVTVEVRLSLELLDVLLTVGIGGFLAIRWTRIDAGKATRLAAVILFSWLVLTEGDFISIIGVLVGLPGIFVVVFGTLFALVADSSFASEDSPRFPRPSRPLLWVGYLIVSVTIVLWSTATHASDVTGNAVARGFFFVGIPMAIWLLTRMPFEAPAERAD